MSILMKVFLVASVIVVVGLALISRVFHSELLQAIVLLILGVYCIVAAILILIYYVISSFWTGTIQAVGKRGPYRTVIVQQENPSQFRYTQLTNIIVALAAGGIAYKAISYGLAILLK